MAWVTGGIVVGREGSEGGMEDEGVWAGAALASEYSRRDRRYADGGVLAHREHVVVEPARFDPQLVVCSAVSRVIDCIYLSGELMQPLLLCLEPPF